MRPPSSGWLPAPLGSLLVVGLVLLAGCNGVAGTTPISPADDAATFTPVPMLDETTVDGDTVTLAPGERGTLTVSATHVRSMIVDAAPRDERTAWLHFSNVTFSPSPTMIWQGTPPNWRWGGVAEVVVEIPVSVPAGAAPGTYRWPVDVYGNHTDATGDLTVHVIANESRTVD